MSRLGPTGLTQLLTDIKTWITTKLGNYVTTDTTQTVTGKKYFTNSTTQVNSVNTFTGSTLFIDTSASAPRGSFPESAYRVGRIYIGDGTSYNGSWFIIDPTIDTNRAYYRMVTTNPDNTDSTRFSITWDGTKTGARCRKNVSMGDLLPAANNTYNLGADDQKWDIGYIHNLIGSNKENLTEDANSYYSTTSGSHMTFYTTSNGGTKLSNVPAAVNTHLESRTIRYLSSSDWIIEQICHNSFGLYYRKGTNGTWEDWKTFAFTNSNITGTAANVTGTVAIANGGTGATTRLSAVKALTNEAVSTPTYFLTITNGWAKAGYTTVAQAKTVLGITGDMGSHSDSEYVHKTGDESITGTKTFGNGTLIVDNGTGNNVHGEIKLNGTRPVYINADNSEDGLFANTACGMSIILNDSSKSIHIGGYSTNSSGRKFIKTTDKAPYLTLGTQEVGTQILVPENDTADSTFSITSTLKYASGASAKSFTVKFKQGDDGSSGVFPVANNKTDLGLSGNRWKNVYATNYYYGADAVEFSTKFVTTDTSQTIAGLKTFANNTMVVGRNTDGNSAIQLINSDVVGDSAKGSSGFEVYGSSISDDNKIGGLTVGEYSNNGGAYAKIEVNRTESGVKTTTAIRSLIRSDGSKEFSPSTDNDIKLGHSSFRWSAIYGNTYYYGSDNTEFSTKFVTTDTAQTITGVKTLNSDTLVANLGNAYRIANSAGTGYGVFQRVDNVNWYLMVTAQNDALGSWTSARPASMNLSTGVLSINGNAATATEFSANKSVTLTGDVTGTASSKAGWSVATTLANSGVTAGSYGPSEAASPAHGGTFSVPYVTVDAKGRVTAASSITITLPSDNNTDTLMTQNVSTTDNTYPILLCATANATSNQGAKTGIFGSGVKVNPKTSVVSAKGFSGVPTGTMYVTAVKDGGALVNSQATAWGAIWRAPTKDYQVAGATWSSNNNNVYICYSVTNANVEAGTNTMAKSLIWAADTGTLTTSTFSGALSGNASSATEFSANKDVTLTGDVTGTASSKAGWSVATTLANSGVTAGTYGPSADVTGNNNATISVPEITVDAKGRVTSVTNRTLTCKNNTYNVYDKTLTIQKNGTNVATFTSNSNTDVTANITVPTKVSELTNDSGYLTAHQSLSNYVTLNTAQEITNTKTFKDANTVVKRTDIEAGNTLPSADKLARNIFQDKNGKELGSIYYYKNTSGDTGLCLRAGDWFSESEGVYSLNASGTNRRAELVLYTNSSGNCCIKPNGLFSAHLKPLDSSVCLAEYGKPFGVAYVNQVRFTNATLQVDVDITATEEHSIGFFGKNNGPLSYITFQKRPSFKDRVAIRVQTSSSAYKSYDFDATCFYPESSNSVDIGSTTNIFKNIYCNNYYKGTTAFGDIVTHNASEFLTSHQSLANYVTLNGAQTISGIKTISTHLRFSSANTRGTAPSANEERDLIDYKDSAGNRISLFETMYYTDKSSKTSIYAYKTTAATGGNIGSIGIGCDASGNVYTYAPTPASLDNSTKIATTAFVYNTAAKHLSAATNIYVAMVATGNGSGSNTSNYMSLTDLRTYLATVHMHSAASSMNGSYNLQILFKAGDSFGDATFDATKMPGVRNLILNTSTGTNSTVNNYSTNSPTFGNINVTGDIAVTMRNLNCTGRISSQHGAYVSIDTYMGISSLMASNYGYLNVAKNMVINVCDAHADYFCLATNNGILSMWPGATVTINFRQQCYYSRSLFMSSSNGTALIGYSSFKLTGTEPMAVWGGSGTLTGTSETAAATVEKAVTLASGQTFTLTTNATAKVKFTVDNTAANPTLNIGGTGAKPIYWNNAPVQATMLMKNITYDVKYNGSQFVIQNAVKRLTNNDFGVFRSSGNYNQTYNSGSWNFTGWALYYGTGIENSNWRGSHIGNIQQNVSTVNNTFPVLISGTANATANTLIAPYFAKGVKINPSTNVVSASGFDGPLTWSGTAFSYIAGNSLYYYSGQPAIANCFEGSSNDFTKFSYPTGGTSASSSNANIQTLRFDWGNTYWHDLFMSPNNNYLWHRNVVNSDARGWRRIVEENVTGLADQSWNINIAGTAANVTGTVDIANGGTGATTRLNAVKALTNESVGTPTHFLAITTNYAKAGYTTVAQAKTVLGITGDIISHSDSEYVHMSGDETVAGVKTFSNNTYITSLNFTSEVESQSSSSSAVFPIVTTVTYADQSPSQTARLNFRITANGDKSLYPHENNQYSFGVTSRRWATLYGYLANLGGTYLGNEASPNERTNLYLLANRDADGQSGAYIGRFRQNKAQGAMSGGDVSFVSFDFLENSTRYTRCFAMGLTDWDSNGVPQTYYLNSPDGKGSLGTATTAWNKVYANSYYLGTTSFTDKFVTTDTAQTVAGTKTFNGDKIVITQGNGYRMVCNTDGGASGYGVFQRVDGSSWYLMVTAQNDALGSWTSARPASMNLSTGVLSINGNAATATEFSANKSVTLTGDVTGTASSKAGWSVATTLANSGVTAGSYGPATAASPAHGGTFSVPYVTVDAKGRITAASTKTITLPADSNTDTKVTQTVTTANSGYPVLLCATANATATETTTSRFSAGLTVNTRYSSIYMTNKYDTANTKGVRDSTTGYLNGNITFRCYDASEMGRIHCESSKNGYQQTYMQARSYIKDGAISPEGTATTCYITVRVRDNGSKTIYTDGSWENSLIPYANATYDLGTSSLRWKACYSNAYYLGTTAFGDIVTHNASEFLTSHQSLSSCVKNVVTNNQTIKSTGITRGTAPSSAQTFGIAFSDNNNKSIGNIYGQYATDKSTYVGLYAYKGTTTSNGDNASVRVGYDASGNAYTYAPTPATADNSTQIATTAFVKAQGYLTSHQSLANYVTTNTDQSISGIKSHSKHISILGDYVGNESSTNGRSCLYLKANRDTDGKSGLYVTKFRQNVAQGSMGNSDVVFLSHDILENETRTNAGFVESYSNWANDVPGGISIYSTIATRNLGTSAKPWTNAYITNLNLNGSAFDPTSIDGIGTVKLLAYAPTNGQEYTLNAGTTKAGSKLGEVWAAYATETTPSVLWQCDMTKTQSGTWKLLNYTSIVTGSGNLKLIGLWVRIS